MLAKQDVVDLLLPTEKILVRNNEECFDIIIVGSYRKDIFDKLLARRYQLSVSDVNFQKEEEHCQIEFITSIKSEKNTKNVAIGAFTKAAQTIESTKNKTSQSLMVKSSYPARLKIADNDLSLKCEKLSGDRYLLSISHVHQKGMVETTLQMNRGITVNLAEIVQELNNKKSTLGIPQSEWLKTEGLEHSSYELIIQ